MSDVHTPATRSYNMSQIKSKDTKPEMLVRQYLHAHGLRYRLHDKSLPGKPDLVLPKYKTVVFVHGCFWHKHEGCPKASAPKTRTEWWQEKIGRNVINDERQQTELTSKGWKVLTMWECRLKPASRENALRQLFAQITRPESV
ncbi:MAG: very short patch repair endonuclease [Janthinobacterium lividum]